MMKKTNEITKEFDGQDKNKKKVKQKRSYF